MLGLASVWAVLLAGFAVLLLVFCFAAAASHFEDTGSGYAYRREAFGSVSACSTGYSAPATIRRGSN